MGETERMKPLAYIVLAMDLIVVVFARFIPIPFLGLMAGFSITPLAHLLSWKDLFTINLFYAGLQQLSGIEGYIWSVNFVRSIMPILPWYFEAIGIVMFLAMIFMATLEMTILQRLFYYILPKRLRLEKVGY